MIRTLPLVSNPAWLAKIATSQVAPKALPLKSILKDSLFYPASDLDPEPIKNFAGNIHSFIYVDYNVSQMNVEQFCQRPFLDGYDVLFEQDIEFADVIPSNWKPTLMLTKDIRDADRFFQMEMKFKPFVRWAVWYSEKDNRFLGFLFISGEMSAIYQGFYSRLKVKPKIVAIIRPGGGLGCGWEHTQSNDSFFHQVVRANSAGMPEYLAWGGYDARDSEHPCWDEYQGPRIAFYSERHVGLWALNHVSKQFVKN